MGDLTLLHGQRGLWGGVAEGVHAGAELRVEEIRNGSERLGLKGRPRSMGEPSLLFSGPKLRGEPQSDDLRLAQRSRENDLTWANPPGRLRPWFARRWAGGVHHGEAAGLVPALGATRGRREFPLPVKSAIGILAAAAVEAGQRVKGASLRARRSAGMEDSGVRRPSPIGTASDWGRK